MYWYPKLVAELDRLENYDKGLVNGRIDNMLGYSEGYADGWNNNELYEQATYDLDGKRRAG